MDFGVGVFSPLVANIFNCKCQRDIGGGQEFDSRPSATSILLWSLLGPCIRLVWADMVMFGHNFVHSFFHVHFGHNMFLVLLCSHFES